MSKKYDFDVTAPVVINKQYDGIHLFSNYLLDKTFINGYRA